MHKYLALLVILLGSLGHAYALEPDASLKKAESTALHGQYDQATRLYQEIIKHNPNHYPAYLGLARVYLATGKYNACLKTYEKLTKELPDDPKVLTGLAELYLLQGKYAQAGKLLKQIHKSNPDHLQTLNLLCELHLHKGRYREAEKQAAFFTTLETSVTEQLAAEELLELAKGLWFYATRTGNKDIFHRVNSQILPAIETLNKNNPALYTFWGSCYLAKDDLTSAEDCFLDALRVNRNHAEATLGLAHCQTDTVKSAAIIAKALFINPNFVEAREFLATIHLTNAQYTRALTETNKALAINPNSISLHGTLASIYFLNHDLKAFEKECRLIRVINPKPARFYYILGNNCVKQWRYLDAQPFYRQAVKLDTKFWDAQIALGLNYMRVGAEGEDLGRNLLERAFKHDPFNVLVYNYLKLLDALDEEYHPVKSDHFTIKLHEREKEVLAPYIVPLLEDAYTQLTALYQFEPEGPLLCEIFPSRSDFSVRMAGIPDINYALGVAFAKTFLSYSPKVQEYLGRRFHWGSVVIHEFTHIITLQLSQFRVPRWFTEGCSVYAEKLYGWPRDLTTKIYEAYRTGQLKHLEAFAETRGFDLVHTYLLSSLMIEYIHQTYGMAKIIALLKGFGEQKKQDEVFKQCLGKSIKEFDREFFDYFENTWLPGHIKLRKKFNPESEAKWLDRLQTNPEDTEALATLAQICLLQDDLLTAQLYAEKALELDPKHTQALLAMGDIFYAKRRYIKVIEYFEQAVATGADDFTTHFHLARAYLKEDMPDKAVASFKKAKQAFPGYARLNDNSYYYLASIYESRDEPELMTQELAGLVKVNHQDFTSRLKLAKLYWKQDKVKEMIEVLEDAVYIEPENLSLHSWLGTGYKAEAMYEKALQEYRVVIFLLRQIEETPKRDKKMSEYYCKQTEIYIELNQLEQARDNIKKALRYDSANKKAWDLDQKLEGE